MVHPTQSTRRFLACGIVGGPLYVSLTLVQALTREGFDMREHRFTLLTAGDLGWLHQANMALVGLLTVLFAVGVRDVSRNTRGALVVPWLLALFGASYFGGGLLTADAVVGFPAGTTEEMVHHTTQAAVQNASRGISTLLLLTTSITVARWFVREGHGGWGWFYGTAIPGLFVALAAFGWAVGVNPVAPAFLATPWIWVTVLAVHLYRRAARRAPQRTASLTASAKSR